jgi:hypothetical protein
VPDQSPSADRERKAETPVEPSKTGRVKNHEKADETTSATAQQKDSSDKFLRRATFTVDVLVFIAVAVYSVFACLQWLAMRGQLKAVRGQLSEMKESKSLAHLDERAWVAPVSVTGKPEIGQYYTIKVETRNTGKTFAKGLKGVALVKYKELSAPDPDFASEEERENIGSPGLLAPNANFTYNLELFKTDKVTKEHMDFLNSPSTVILVFGKITYRDIFDCEHWTTFCYHCTPSGDCYTYGPHNDADDNRCP